MVKKYFIIFFIFLTGCSQIPPNYKKNYINSLVDKKTCKKKETSWTYDYHGALIGGTAGAMIGYFANKNENSSDKIGQMLLGAFTIGAFAEFMWLFENDNFDSQLREETKKCKENKAHS